MFSFCIFFPPMFPLFPKFSPLLQGCEKSGKLPGEKNPELLIRIASLPSIFILKLVGFCLNHASSPPKYQMLLRKSRAVLFMISELEMWMPIIREVRSGVWKSFIKLECWESRWALLWEVTFPRSCWGSPDCWAGLANQRGGSGRTTAPQIVLCFLWGHGGARSWPWDLPVHVGGEVELPPLCPDGRAGENYPSCTAKALWG